MKKLSFGVLFFFVVTACQIEGNKCDDLDVVFSQEVKLGEGVSILLNGFHQGYPDHIFQDSLLCSEIMNSEFSYSIYNLNNGNLVALFGKNGNGPEEFLNIRTINPEENGDELFMLDGVRDDVFTFKVDSLVHSTPHPTVLGRFNADSVGNFTMAAISEDSTLLTVGFLPQGAYCLYNWKSGRAVKYIGQYPDIENNEHKSNRQQGQVYQSLLKRQPLGGGFVNAYCTAGGIEFLSSEKGEIAIVKSYLFHTPKFMPVAEEGHTVSVFLPENRLGFRSLACNHKKVFALYSGRSKKADGVGKMFNGRDIYVFDWVGNPIKHLVLERDAQSIVADNYGKYLYILYVSPDYSLERYSIDQL